MEDTWLHARWDGGGWKYRNRVRLLGWLGWQLLSLTHVGGVQTKLRFGDAFFQRHSFAVWPIT